MSRWEQALDAQTELLNFWRGPNGERYARGMAKAVGEKRAEEAGVFAHSHLWEAHKLERAAPIYVAAETLDLVEAAAESFEPELIFPTDLPVPAGFAYLERPLSTPDISGHDITYRAFSWGPMEDVRHGGIVYRLMGGRDGSQVPGIVLSLYSHIDDHDYWNDLIRDHPDRARQVGLGGLSMSHLTPITFPDDEQQADPEYLREVLQVAGNEKLWVTCQVFWRLMGQRILLPEAHRPPRATRRRAARAGVEETPGVLVVRLRRPESRSRPSEVGAPQEHDHRWPVTGHWRNQWYPSLSAHRQIWIDPYIKGPEDKPLKLRPGVAYEFIQ